MARQRLARQRASRRRPPRASADSCGRHAAVAFAEIVGPLLRQRLPSRSATGGAAEIRQEPVRRDHHAGRRRRRAALAQGRDELRSSVPCNRRRADIFDAHPRDAVTAEAEQVGSARRQIDLAIGVIGAAIVHAHDQRFVGAQIGDAHVARHRHGRMRGRDRLHVVDFAVGGEAAVEIVAVPRGEAFVAVARGSLPAYR